MGATGSVGTFDPVILVLRVSLDRSPRLQWGESALVTQDIEAPEVRTTQDIEAPEGWPSQDIEAPEVRTTQDIEAPEVRTTQDIETSIVGSTHHVESVGLAHNCCRSLGRGRARLLALGAYCGLGRAIRRRL
jgi:hypothetical protein